jgi:hypothetical protein
MGGQTDMRFDPDAYCFVDDPLSPRTAVLREIFLEHTQRVMPLDVSYLNKHWVPRGAVQQFRESDFITLEVEGGIRRLADIPLKRAWFRFLDSSRHIQIATRRKKYIPDNLLAEAVTMLPWTAHVEGELSRLYGERVEVERFTD